MSFRCLQCDVVVVNTSNRRVNKYCSQQCAGAGRRGTHEELLRNFTCRRCGKIFSGRPKLKPSNYCSMACLRAAAVTEPSEISATRRLRIAELVRVKLRKQRSDPHSRQALYDRLYTARVKKNPDDLQMARARRYEQKMFKVHGLTKQQLETMIAACDGACEICRRPVVRVWSAKERGKSRQRALTVDHDHVTGAVRGILCNFCNIALGAMTDSPESLRAAAEYIENSRRRLVHVAGV